LPVPVASCQFQLQLWLFAKHYLNFAITKGQAIILLPKELAACSTSGSQVHNGSAPFNGIHKGKDNK
jgi:hypothetical protein